ncbi:hypothetical protein ACLOAV_002951 [Pseudogymnoascus australis]
MELSPAHHTADNHAVAPSAPRAQYGVEASFLLSYCHLAAATPTATERWTPPTQRPNCLSHAAEQPRAPPPDAPGDEAPAPFSLRGAS